MGLNFVSALILLQFGAWSCNGDFIRLGRGLTGRRSWNHHWYHHTQHPEQWPQGGDSHIVKFHNPHPPFYHYQLHPQMPLPVTHQQPQPSRYNPLPKPQRLHAPHRLPHFHPLPPAQQPPNPPLQPPHRTRPDEPRASQSEKILHMKQLQAPPQASSGPCGLVVVNHVVEGREAPRGFLPWQVAMIYRANGGEERMGCSGILIHPRFVLTAQHCVDPRVTNGAKLLGVLLGATDLRKRDNLTRYYVVDKVISHPDYRSVGKKGEKNPADISILRLPEPAPYTEFIRPVCLPRTKVPGDLGSQSQVFRAAGWGAMNTTFEKENSNVLLWVNLPSVNATECAKQLRVFVDSERQVCAGGQKEDTCDGDSGTGLVGLAPVATKQSDRTFEVVGILSFGKDLCGQRKAAVYTRVDAFLPWIQNILSSG